jgi:myo-inositol-1(or 4)-monophosphatase
VSLSQAERETFLAAARDVAYIAGARVEHWAGKRHSLVIEEKGAQDFVSEADRRVEQLIVEELALRFPDHTFYGEELSKGGDGKKPTWVIDPIDGTTNFLKGIPLYAVSIGLAIDDDIEVGVIHLPHLNETFTATKGGGAFLDGVRIAPSKCVSLANASVAVGSSNRASKEGYYSMWRALNEQGADVRRMGSACVQIAYTACGRLDGFAEQHLNSWDVAAGLCIAREAGARTNEFMRGDWLKRGGAFFCAAPGIYDALAHSVLPA